MSKFNSFDFRMRCPTVIVGHTLTQQSHAAECDINRIVKRYDATGFLPPQGDAQYLDVTHLQTDLTDQIVKSMDVTNQFAADKAEHDKKQKDAEVQRIKELEASKARLDKLLADQPVE